MKSASGRVTDFGKKVGGLKGTLDNLNRSFGESSAFGRMTKILAGAGIAAGVTIVAREIERAAEASVELVDKFREGKISAKELAFEIATSIPVLNNVRGAAEAVYAMFDNTKRRAELLAESYDRTLTIADRLREANQRIRLLQTPKMFRPKLELEFAMENELAKIDAMRREATTDLERVALDRLAVKVREEFALKMSDLESPFGQLVDRIKKGMSDAWDTFAKKAKATMAAARREAEAYRNELRSIGERISESLQTPMEKFQMALYDARRAFVAGFLSDKQLAAYTERLRADLVPAVSSTPAGRVSGGQFRQIDPTRTYIPGLSGGAANMRGKPQKVESDQFAEMIRIQRELLRSLSGGVTAVA